jgi:hypothetical protein
MGIKAAVVLTIAITSSAYAQSSQIEQTAKAARQGYEDCFYGSARSQVRAKVSDDMNLIAEQAFLACQTEEQAMYALMVVNHVPQNQASALIVGVKLQLKRILRDIAANPAKYAFPAKR